MHEVRNKLEGVFRRVFRDPTMVLSDDVAPNDVAGWDSMTNIDLIIAIESCFSVRFATAEISAMKAENRDIGYLVRLIERKLGGLG